MLVGRSEGTNNRTREVVLISFSRSSSTSPRFVHLHSVLGVDA